MWSFSLLSPLFKRKSLIMKNISTGFGLCAIAAAVALYPVLDRFAPIAKEAHAGIPVTAITSAALAQTAPTIVWYGTSGNPRFREYSGSVGTAESFEYSLLYRAWSDGRVEARKICPGNSCGSGISVSGSWTLVNSPTDGLAAASDSDFNGQVDGADLGRLLGNWGDAPRDQIPTSDCPLNLINP